MAIHPLHVDDGLHIPTVYELDSSRKLPPVGSHLFDASGANGFRVTAPASAECFSSSCRVAD